MSTFEKTKEEILSKPTRTDIMPKDLMNFLEKFGFRLKRIKGDHYIYEFPSRTKNFMMDIPMAKPVKAT